MAQCRAIWGVLRSLCRLQIDGERLQMMNREIKARLKKIEERFAPQGGIVVFKGYKDEDFERQREESLSKGGNPNSLFIYLHWQGGRESDGKS